MSSFASVHQALTEFIVKRISTNVEPSSGLEAPQVTRVSTVESAQILMTPQTSMLATSAAPALQVGRERTASETSMNVPATLAKTALAVWSWLAPEHMYASALWASRMASASTTTRQT